MEFRRDAITKDSIGDAGANSMSAPGRKTVADALVLKLVLVAVSSAAAVSIALPHLVRTWSGRDDYSHGFIVPLISLYLVWSKRGELRSIEIAPQVVLGLFATAAGCLALVLGDAGGVSIAEQVSVVVIIPGVVLLVLGTGFLRALALPLLYLVFMVPVFDVLISRLHWPAQLFSAVAASKMLVAMGIPVFRNMQFLELPNISLEVARECSGINYLLSIVAVGAPLAYFTQRTALRKASLIVFAVIVGVVANAVRITLIGVWAYMGGAVVHGPMHILQGFSVSVAGFAFLFAGAWALGGRGPRIEEADAKGGMDEGLSVKPEAMGRLNIAVAVAISLLLATSGFIYLHKVNDVPLKKDIKDIPLHIRQWSGAPYISGFSLAGATSEHSILYSDQNGAQTMFYIGYFSSQTQGREMVDFRLANIYSRSERFYIKAPAGAEYSVSKAIVNEGGRRFLLMYWYDLGGRVVADRFAQKFYTAIGGIFLRRTNGAMLMLSREITADASVEEVLRDEAMLAGDMIEALRGMVPQ